MIVKLRAFALGFVGLSAAAAAIASCGRHTADSAQSAAAPTAPASTAGQPAAAPPAAALPSSPVATGPRAELHGEHYAFEASLAAPTAVPGDGNLTVEVHGSTGYHVNQLYPVALDLTPTNASAPAQLRRADASQLTQEVAMFRVPVHVTAPGATIRGTMRFAVCSEQNCVPQSQAFAVALP